MNRQSFRLYRKNLVDCMRVVLETNPGQILNEAGFPAYAHKNFLFSNPFWRRIEHITNYLQDKTVPIALDFGCGGGVMLPYLATLADKVIAADHELGPFADVNTCRPFNEKIETLDLSRNSLADIKQSSVDLILALDVLEHVENLENTIRLLVRLLAPGGEMIVSGPTETLYYRIGRKLAGREFSGDYHERDIYKVEEKMLELIPTSHLVTINYPIPIFEIFLATKN